MAMNVTPTAEPSLDGDAACSATGETIRVRAACRDISDRRVAAEEMSSLQSRLLRESEERYRTLLDGLHDYAIYFTDPRGNVVSWNTGAERIKGYTAEEIVGRHFSCFFTAEDIERGAPEEILSEARLGSLYGGIGEGAEPRGGQV